jgi:hypothetical protein
MFPPNGFTNWRLASSIPFAQITQGHTDNGFITTRKSLYRLRPLGSGRDPWHSVVSTLRRYTAPYLIEDADKWFHVEVITGADYHSTGSKRLELKDNLENLLLTLNLRRPTGA